MSKVCSLEHPHRHPSGLRTMESGDYPGVRGFVNLPMRLPAGCCPVSGNPQPGSTLTLRHRDGGRVLEVYALREYLRWYVGGHPSGERNMEGMVKRIARDCADALGVRVRARAELLLDTGPVTLSFTARPGEPSRAAGTPAPDAGEPCACI